LSLEKRDEMSEIDLLIEELEDIENNPIKPFVAIRIGGYLRNYKYHEYRIAELEEKQRWIPVSEPPKECEMRVFKDGDAWCFVLPDFQDLQASPSVWMKKGALDKIYKELRSVRNEYKRKSE
jgi:hypothetical protein